MVRWITGSILHYGITTGITKAVVAYKYPLLLTERVAHEVAVEFRLSLPNGSLPYVRRKQNVLSASFIKTFPSFFALFKGFYMFHKYNS